MSNIDTSGPAFPTAFTNRSGSERTGFMGDSVPAGTYTEYMGISIRDHFAGLAMQALIREMGRVLQHSEGVAFSGLAIEDNEGGTPTAIADDSYAMADAMLKARSAHAG